MLTSAGLLRLVLARFSATCSACCSLTLASFSASRLALNSSAAYLESVNQSLDAYNYDNKAVADIIMDNMEKVKFEGISVSLGAEL